MRDLDIHCEEITTIGDHVRGMHLHDTGQLTYVREGVVSIETDFGFWVAPTGRLAWIPPRVSHAANSRGAMTGWRILLPHHLTDRLPSRPSVLKASTLLVAALDRARSLREHETELRHLLAEIIHIELAAAQPEEFGLPLPTSESIKSWALTFIRSPRISVSIDDVARETGVSRRTLSRRFAGEMALTFNEWRQTVITQYAIARISEGESVGAVSFDVGYESPSAFIAMFKAMVGSPPGAFARGAKK